MGLSLSAFKRSVLAQFAVTPKIAMFARSQPGMGKSAVQRDIARELLASFGLQPIVYDSGCPETAETANVVEFNAALRDPTDILGLPHNSGRYSYWTPPAEFYALRHGTGPKVLIVEEASDALTPMQNALCRVVYDHQAGNLRLTDELFILMNGNRTEDKSGANRLVTKLSNRVRIIDIDFNMEDFIAWSEDSSIPRTVAIPRTFIQFWRFRPNLVMDFDPKRDVNPTPRSWERVTQIPTTLSDVEYFENVKGEVNEGAAAEWVGFRKIASSVAQPEEVVLRPSSVAVPLEPAALYAMTGSLAEFTTKDNIEKIALYIERMPKEFQVMYMLDAQKLKPEVKMTKAFIGWATKNAQVLFTGSR